FWLNTDDADVIDRLKVFTFLSRSRVEELAEAVVAEPFRRAAQRTLAFEVTSLVHGEAATAAPMAAADALCGQGDLALLDATTLESALAELPRADAEQGATVAQLLVAAGLTKSLAESRRAIEQGGVYLNNVKVTDSAETIDGHLLF